MGKIHGSSFGTKRAKLEVSDLTEEVATLTLEDAEEIDIDDPSVAGGVRKALLLSFRETDKVLWLNRTMVETLITKLGDDTDLWAGKTIPVEKVQTTFKGKVFHKVAVCAADDWDEYIAPKKAAKKSRK